VISVVRLLAELRDTRTLNPLRALITHEDPAIRREAIRAVGAIGSDNVLAMLQPALADEHQDIRVAAIRAIAESAPTAARGPLLEVARSRDFPRRAYFEKKEVLSALAAIANQEIEEWLISVAKKRAWLRREERDELRACAISALARIGSESALEVVRACTQDRSAQVRRAAAQAMR
jgi:HEAT repeat protein